MKFKFALYDNPTTPTTLDTRSYSNPAQAHKFARRRLIQLADKHIKPYILQANRDQSLDNVTGVTAIYIGTDINRDGECICTELCR